MYLITLSTSSVHCHCSKIHYTHPCHQNHLPPHVSDSHILLRLPTERQPLCLVHQQRGGRSIEGALIITNHLPGRESWHFFITVVITLIITRAISWRDICRRLITQRDETLSECNHLEGTLAGNLAERVTTWWSMQIGYFSNVRTEPQVNIVSYLDPRWIGYDSLHFVLRQQK